MIYDGNVLKIVRFFLFIMAADLNDSKLSGCNPVEVKERTETVYVAKPTYSRNEKMEYVNVRYISKLCTQPQKFINELYVRAYVQQFVEP